MACFHIFKYELNQQSDVLSKRVYFLFLNIIKAWDGGDKVKPITYHLLGRKILKHTMLEFFYDNALNSHDI